mgnify:CR=1 FL=1
MLRQRMPGPMRAFAAGRAAAPHSSGQAPDIIWVVGPGAAAPGDRGAAAARGFVCAAGKIVA